MKQIAVRYENAMVSDDTIAQIGEQLKPEIDRVSKAWGSGYSSEHAFLSLPSDAAMHQQVQSVVSKMQKLEPTMLIVVGIGGSNLGTIAVHESLQGLFYNTFNPLKIYFADTVDSAQVSKLLALADQELSSDSNVIIAVVTKSGITTETIANAQVFIQLLQKHHPANYHEFMVAITDEKSPLWAKAVELNWTVLLIPKKVGGRYSVFSPVGLFPFGMLGIDIDQLVKGAESIKEACCNPDIFQNPAALSAVTLYDRHKQGAVIHDTFVFALRLAGIGAWYRQLMAESIGKAESRTGQVINEGITPTVSVGSIDLHSVAQLYLGGPYDKFTTFLSVEKLPNNLMVPTQSVLSGLVDNLQGVSFNHIMNAILQGVQKAYKKNKRPFISVELPEISAYYIGQLLQAKMVKMMYLGFLLEVNPFNQPEVELYKKETRKILSHE